MTIQKKFKKNTKVRMLAFKNGLPLQKRMRQNNVVVFVTIYSRFDRVNKNQRNYRDKIAATNLCYDCKPKFISVSFYFWKRQIH
jgi:hypothetical protein